MSKNFIYDENIKKKDKLIIDYPLCMISGNIILSSVKGQECNHIEGYSKIYLKKFLTE